ncbi:MAG: type I restriction enzyme endonuclease domain-containing protein [bacterium]
MSTLYIDKPMKAHTLMQAIARANRVYPGKDFGLIVDYNGMLKSLRQALALYALADEAKTEDEVIAPIETRVQALHDAIEETEAHLRFLKFDAQRLVGATGFARIEALADAVEAVYTSDDAKHRFEILARQVFVRFKALVMAPASFAFAERRDNLEAIYKKLEENRDNADVTDVLKELHRIVNDAIRTADTGNAPPEPRLYDLSKIDLKKLSDEFAKKVKRKASALQDIRKLVEEKLKAMLAHNPSRMDYYKKYSEIIADYNCEKDRVSIEETFAKLAALLETMSVEDRRAVEEGLSEEELALFDLLTTAKLSKAERERVKLASRSLLDSISKLVRPVERWTEKEQTQGEVEVLILDHLFRHLPTPPFCESEKQQAAQRVYLHIWQQSAAGLFPGVAA